jgi:hypothetical protein
MSDGLKKVLEEAERRAAERPEWARSDYAQREIARLQNEAPLADSIPTGKLPDK